MMDTHEEKIESFQEGMAIGQAAGRKRDLLFAAGFVVGFVWGAILEARSERHAFEQVA